MLSRMNFASALAGNQRANLAAAAMPFAQTPESLLSYLLDRLSVAPLSDPTYQALLTYAGSVERWTGSEAQVRTKVTGLVHLILGSGEYVFV
jgi:hypothetical protein